ncbi:ABC transporter permease [Microbacterium sp.]|uniref:ABC transporter permease n=1 Tax=Microbacterium sp. TaxID=51671 RepID=UPI002605B3BC|nr:ABC transporter permease [Microbacterium sp.]
MSTTGTRSVGTKSTARTTSGWGRFLGQKAVEVGVALAALILLTFVLVLLVPGDPARIAAGLDASVEQVEAARTALGLDQPIPVQFLHYVTGIFTGDLGQSFRTGQDVTTIIGVRLPYTLTIALVAIAITLVISVAIGIGVAGLTRGNRNRWLDVGFSWVTATLQTLPVYVFGAILVIVFAVSLGVLPAAGATSPASYVLPAVALTLAPTCSISRIVRREAAAVLEQDYMRTARGWRIDRIKQHMKYALPNLLASTLTLSGLILGNMLGGAVIVERVFAWPGLGNGVVEAILERDYPLIRGIILTIGVIAIIINVTIDIILAVVDPRVLRSGKAFA